MRRSIFLLALSLLLATTHTVADEACSLEVTVVDEAGNPAPAGIEARATPAQGPPSSLSLAGGGAPAVFEGIPCGAWRIAAGWTVGWKPSPRFRVHGETDVVLVEGIPAQATLTVPVLHPVTVRVVDEDGQAIRNGFVAALCVPSSDGRHVWGASASLDENGLARLFLEPGRFEIRSSRPVEEIRESRVDGRPDGPRPVVDVHAPVKVVFRVKATVRVRGVVRDTEGNGIPDVYLESYEDGEMHCVRCWLTGPDGSFTAGVSTLPVVLAPRHELAQWVFEPDRVLVDEARKSQGLLFIGRPNDSRMLAGVIVAPDTGEPVADASIYSDAECPETERFVIQSFAHARSDPAGRFRVPCPEGCSPSLWIEAPRGSPYLRVEWDGVPADCDEEQRIALRSGRAVFGTVEDSKGRPVIGLPVAAGSAQPTETDGEGRYEIVGLWAGNHSLSIPRHLVNGERAKWVLVPATSERDRPEVVIAEEDERVRFDLRVVDGGRVCLTVEGEDGSDVPLGDVALYVAGEEERRSRRSSSRTEHRDRPERLCTQWVAPGRYELRVGRNTRGFVPVWWPGEEDRDFAVEVEIEPGKVTELGPLPLRPAGQAYFDVAGFELTRDTRLGIDLMPVPVKDPEADPEEEDRSKWEAVQDDWITPVLDWEVEDERREGGLPESGDPLAEIGLAPFPAGRWQIRLCAGEKGCKGDRIWCSEEPVLVEQGKLVRPVLVPSDDPSCPAPIPDEKGPS